METARWTLTRDGSRLRRQLRERALWSLRRCVATLFEQDPACSGTLTVSVETGRKAEIRKVGSMLLPSLDDAVVDCASASLGPVTSPKKLRERTPFVSYDLRPARPTVWIPRSPGREAVELLLERGARPVAPSATIDATPLGLPPWLRPPGGEARRSVEAFETALHDAWQGGVVSVDKATTQAVLDQKSNFVELFQGFDCSRVVNRASWGPYTVETRPADPSNVRAKAFNEKLREALGAQETLQTLHACVLHAGEPGGRPPGRVRWSGARERCWRRIPEGRQPPVPRAPPRRARSSPGRTGEASL